MTEKVSLDHAVWEYSDRIGDGGYGAVYAASSNIEARAAIKFVPKEPGADRELLFANPSNARNVVPIVDSGETDTHWVLAMPRADMSLKSYLETQTGLLDLDNVIAVLTDIATALIDLEQAQVVHRDIKPANILLLNGAWCLADFGISRYAEATTAPDTRKFAMTYKYAAPERWRGERATSATDIYSTGIIAYEMVAGRAPFSGDPAQLRNAHLHNDPPPVHGIPPSFAAIIEDCLSKSPGSRPSPENLLKRLVRASVPPAAGSIARLQEANLAEVKRRAAAARAESEANSALERRSTIARDAARSLRRISDTLRESVIEAATAAILSNERDNRWSVRLNNASLTVSEVTPVNTRPWGNTPAFDVVAYASLGVRIPANRWNYEGRSHSLWFCDAREDGRFGWFETAFMNSAFSRNDSSISPFAMAPQQGVSALGGGIGGIQLAWPFSPITYDDIDEFVNRWIGWFADAASGTLNRPSMMPEKQAQGSYRVK
ncbi:serine/threonine-protein kinase [Catellatospora sp. TT07R-123]|uniref:serine/threonine-protein kinase n=1 Tax=Catellatospora sp. TT07R-123 TaxID=2733863 RepID=UPI001BB43133|nr:serine/threonine-protein kinase [Catellatospora sp. TT07R-123]